jgi:SAM-dependent methyltransferase
MSQPDAETSRYIHGTTAPEQDRLSILNDLINEASLREIRLAPGDRVLDVGCGLGQLTRAFGRTVGSGGRVVGIERSPEQVAKATRLAREAGESALVDLRQGEAGALPLLDDEWGTFDVAHARFVLEHLRDPLDAVRQMVWAVRPGGRIVLADDDHDVCRLWPEPPGFNDTWRAYMRLVALLYEAGARPQRNTWIFFGSCAGHPTFEIVVENLIGILEGAWETMRRERLIDHGLLVQTISALRAWKQRPDAAFWYAIAWAEGIRGQG